MKTVRNAFNLLLIVAATNATAQAYKCLDPHGKIEYRGTPCATSQTVEKTFSQPTPNETERANRATKLNPSAVSHQENLPASPVTNREEGARPTGSPIAPAPSPVTATTSGGLCTGPFSWDECRKFGIDSVVDCKRMDEDVVFRTSVLQSKGIVCRYADESTRRNP